MADRTADDDRVERLTVPNPLHARIARHSGENADSLFMAADSAIAEQARLYPVHACDDCEAAGEAVRTAIAGGEAGSEALDRLYGIVHDIKGQAATFGYPLASEICARLCRLLSRRPHLNEAELRIVQAHVQGLGIVFGHRLAGDGGPPGRQLSERLRRLAERAKR